jgi:hypothetical protein
MFSSGSLQPFGRVQGRILLVALLGLAWAALVVAAPPVSARTQSTAPTSTGGQQTEAPPDAGGPQNDVGPYAIPKKKDEPPPPPPPERPKKVEGMPDYSLHVDVPLVNVDVMVTTKQGQFISTLT